MSKPSKKPAKQAKPRKRAKTLRGPAKRAYSLPSRPGGVIDTIIKFISRKEGATALEIVAHLAKRFPDREAKRTTAQLNASIWCTRSERTDKGVRYWRTLEAKR